MRAIMAVAGQLRRIVMLIFVGLKNTGVAVSGLNPLIYFIIYLSIIPSFALLYKSQGQFGLILAYPATERSIDQDIGHVRPIIINIITRNIAKNIKKRDKYRYSTVSVRLISPFPTDYIVQSTEKKVIFPFIIQIDDTICQYTITFYVDFALNLFPDGRVAAYKDSVSPYGYRIFISEDNDEPEYTVFNAAFCPREEDVFNDIFSNSKLTISSLKLHGLSELDSVAREDHGNNTHFINGRIAWLSPEPSNEDMGGARLNLVSSIQSHVDVTQAEFNEIVRYADGRTGETSDMSGNFWRMLYFSSTVATTLGLGDIIPGTPTVRFLVALEAVTSLVTMGLFLNALAFRAGQGKSSALRNRAGGRSDSRRPVRPRRAGTTWVRRGPGSPRPQP